MKRIAENRYPHSATLFQFCKEALALRYDGNVKVIDQDVGAILGYDPADCSHWKKGKKNIRSLTTLKNLADYLQIDDRLLIDIASGRVDLEEAVFEFKGYGQFALQGQNLENYKKEFFKNPEKWTREGRSKPFEELFDINREHVVKIVENILLDGQFREAPIYLPEVYSRFGKIELINVHDLEKDRSVEYTGAGTDMRAVVKFRDSEMRPYLRFLIAKDLFLFLCRSRNELVRAFFHSPEEVLDIQGNIFAGLLLIPGSHLRKEVERIDCSLDIVQQLANLFWVSKALVNKRLGDYMENLS